MENENVTVWGQIYDVLKQNGFDVYSPGVKVGECTKEYVVVVHGTGAQYDRFTTYEDIYTIMCYVPKQAYSRIEAMLHEVKLAMRDIFPQVMPYGMITPSFYDDSVKAHTISIDYKNYKRMILGR